MRGGIGKGANKGQKNFPGRGTACLKAQRWELAKGTRTLELYIMDTPWVKWVGGAGGRVSGMAKPEIKGTQDIC